MMHMMKYYTINLSILHGGSINVPHHLKAKLLIFECISLCVYLCVCRERCGVIKIRQPGVQRHWRERETVFQNGPAGLRRLTRKRYIDLGNEHTHCDRIRKAPNNKQTWSAGFVKASDPIYLIKASVFDELGMRLKKKLPYKLYCWVNCTPKKLWGNILYIDLQFYLFFFLCVCVPSCRWGRSGPRKEQVRCTGLWHTA